MSRHSPSLLLIVGVLFLVACGKGDEPTASAPSPAAVPAPAPAPVAESEAVVVEQPEPAALPAADDLAARLQAGLAAPDRSVEDKARDASRNPIGVMEFMGVEAGMTALDLIAGGGYYTEVLAAAVGPTGKVLSHNTDFILHKIRDGANSKTMTARLADNRLPNVEMWVREFGELGLDREADFALLSLNLHDLLNMRGEDGAKGVLAEVNQAVKPGSVLGIIEHAGVVGADNKELHRMTRGDAERLITGAGFVIEATSDLLAHAEDDHTLGVFDPSIRGKTDRFVIRARKPKP